MKSYISQFNFWIFASWLLMANTYSSVCSGQKSILFNSTGAYLDVPNHASLQSPTLTLEFWLKVHETTNLANGEQTIFDKRQNNNGFNVRLAGTAFPANIFGFYEPNLNALPSTSIDRKRWKHFAFVFAKDTTKVYVNGILNLVKKSELYDESSAATLFIGEFHGYPGGSLPLRGELDDIRIWNSVRSAVEIKNNMHVQLTGNESNLQLYYDFESTNSAFVLDKSKNRNNAFIRGRPVIQNSDAPVGYIPLSVPLGFRAFGNDRLIKLEWDEINEATSYKIYRSDKADFDLTGTTLIVNAAKGSTKYSDQSITKDKLYYYVITAIDKDGHEGTPSIVFPTRTSLNVDYQTGVYYYPWYQPEINFHPWPQAYLRDFLQPPQPPELGQYSCNDPTVLNKQFTWMRDHSIDYLVSSWWGKGTREDNALKNNIVPLLNKYNLKFAVYFESAILGLVNGKIEINSTNKANFLQQFDYLSTTYFSSPNYLKLDGRPVVFIYLADIFAGDNKNSFQEIRNASKQKGFDIFLIGDLNIFQPISNDFASTMDGFSPYLPYNGFHHLLPKNAYPNDIDFLGSVARANAARQVESRQMNKLFIPNVWPGENVSHIDPATTVVFPRQLGKSYSHHSVYENLIKTSKPFVDPTKKMIMITSWNEWHEDTQIEPTIFSPPSNKDKSGDVNTYSRGYEYNGYGDIFLRVTKELLGFDNTVPISSKKINKDDFLIYPNPVVNNQLYVDFSESSILNGDIAIFNTLGTLIYKRKIVSNDRITINTTNWQGIHIIRITSGNIERNHKILCMGND